MKDYKDLEKALLENSMYVSQHGVASPGQTSTETGLASRSRRSRRPREESISATRNGNWDAAEELARHIASLGPLRRLEIIENPMLPPGQAFLVNPEPGLLNVGLTEKKEEGVTYIVGNARFVSDLKKDLDEGWTPSPEVIEQVVKRIDEQMRFDLFSMLVDDEDFNQLYDRMMGEDTEE